MNKLYHATKKIEPEASFVRHGGMVYWRSTNKERNAVGFYQDGWILAYTCWNDTEADLLIAYLDAEGIEAVSNSRVPHSVLPFIADGLGEVQVFVREEFIESARRALERWKAESNKPDEPDENE